MINLVDEEADSDQVDEAIESQEATSEAVDEEIEEIGTEELSDSNNQEDEEDEEELDASLASFLNI